MEKEKKSSVGHKVLKVGKLVFLILLGLYIILIIGRLIYRIHEAKVDKQVAKIHSAKISLDDVMGKNLPPDPGVEADKTIQGIDANKNGIRDDVELAIFNAYTDSAKTRAVLLQYAFALQMETVQPFVDTKTVTEVVTEEGRSHSCVADILVPRKNSESDRSDYEVSKIFEYTDYIEGIQFNTEARREARQNFLKSLRSFGDSTNETCDIDVSTLSN